MVKCLPTMWETQVWSLCQEDLLEKEMALPGKSRSQRVGHNWVTSLSLWTNFRSSEGKESACNSGDQGSIPGSGRSLGGGHGNPFQYSCLENPHRQRNLAGYSPWGCTESDTTEQLHFHFTFTSPDTSTTEHHFHFGPDASFFLELLVVALHSFPEVYWTPSSLRGSSGFIYFSLFVVFMGFLR